MNKNILLVLLSLKISCNSYAREIRFEIPLQLANLDPEISHVTILCTLYSGSSRLETGSKRVNIPSSRRVNTTVRVTINKPSDEITSLITYTCYMNHPSGHHMKDVSNPNSSLFRENARRKPGSAFNAWHSDSLL